MKSKVNTETSKGRLDDEQKKPEAHKVPTVTPDNENGDPGPPVKPETKTTTQK
ncbi:hypothetical protein [Mucilaginibacter endophyticus]|uniref:hypothetical protein n=1 Tax=Mucilaginibacter endophyticus TaxID=2675003 RepID=UPI0012B17902|nr:hypothetical protein [Mucilaginibacter endophyticus]